MLKSIIVVGLLYSVVARGRTLSPKSQELQGEMDEASGKAGLEGPAVSAPTAPDSKEGSAERKFQDASQTMASVHRTSPEDQEADAEIAQAMATPSSVGTPEAPPAELPDISCVIDWSAPCPSGWEGPSPVCQAGPEYEGPCFPSQDLSGLSENSKRAFARVCSVEFGCQKECTKDYSGCPSAWQEIAPGVCEAPGDYAGSCDGRLEASLLTTKDKELWASACGAGWPCMSAAKCPVDYSGLCPSGWLASGDECLAPPSYSGGCAGTNSFATFTPAEKEQWSMSCGASWPCRT